MHETYESWHKICYNLIYRSSSGINENLPPSSFLTQQRQKYNVSKAVETDQWQNISFSLQNIAGLRRSSTQYRQIFVYTDY